MGHSIRTVIRRAPGTLIADIIGCAALVALAAIALYLPAFV